MIEKSVTFGRRYLMFLMVFLGVLSAFGPFMTDMYLPVLPGMAKTFNCSASMTQLGLTMGMVGLACGQLFFGPLSDKYGRRHVLQVSMSIFLISTLLILFSPDIEWFNACRLFQGIGGAGGIVLSRSIATDYYSGRDLTKTLAIIGAINGVAPVASPVVGGIVSSFSGWEGIFFVLLLIGIVIMLMTMVFRESLPEERRLPNGIISTFGSYLRLLRLPYFCVYLLMYAFSFGVLFGYISSASFILQNHFGLSPLLFSITFGINSTFVGIGAGLAVKMRSCERAALTGGVLLASFSLLHLFIPEEMESFLLYEAGMAMILTSVGFVFTSATTLTMTEGRRYVGAASALFGACGFLFGGIVSPIVGMGDLMGTSRLLIFVCSTAVLATAILAARRKDREV